jgi:hypothetical protein
MSRLSFLTVTLVLLVFGACRKDDAFFDTNAEAIVVDVLWKNDVNGSGLEEPVPRDQVVFISVGSNTAEYIFKGKTDNNGRCSFANLPAGEYTVWASRTIPAANNEAALVLKQSNTGTSLSRRLVLVPGAEQTGFVLRCLNNAQEPMTGLKVCIQTTAAAAALGCVTPTFPELVTDAQGRAAKWGIGAGVYYVRVATTTGTLLRLDTVTVSAGILSYDTLTVTLPTVTGLELHCRDANTVGVPGLTIHGYATEALANTGNTTLSAFEVTAVGNGVYRKEGIAPQQYWLRFVSTEQSIDQVQAVSVPDASISPTDILITPITPTGYQIFCYDGADSGIPGLIIDGYATQALADSLFTSLASFHMDPVDAYGTYRVVGIPPGNYWLGISNTELDIDTFRQVTVTENVVFQDSFDVIP